MGTKRGASPWVGQGNHHTHVSLTALGFRSTQCIHYWGQVDGIQDFLSVSVLVPDALQSGTTLGQCPWPRPRVKKADCFQVSFQTALTHLLNVTLKIANRLVLLGRGVLLGSQSVSTNC